MTLPPFHWWRTVFVLIPAIAVYTTACGLVSLVSTLVDRQGHLAHRCARLWARLILITSGVRIDRVGPMPAESESCVFVANHASIYDIPIVFAAVPHQLRIMAKAALGYVPFIGWHLHLAGHVLVNRTNPGAGILKRMQRMTRQNASLIIFPEASRSTDGALKRFKPGIFLLAIENRLPIVPLTIDSSRRVMPKGRLAVTPATVRVTVHEPIATSALTRADVRDLAARVQAVVASALTRRDSTG